MWDGEAKTIKYKFKMKIRFDTESIFLKAWAVTKYVMFKDMCIPITFNNTLKASFSKNRYPITIQTHPTQIV